MKEAVLVILETSNGSVLLLDRNANPMGWGLPGGKVEDSDETLEDAAVREVFEETGFRLMKVFLKKIDEAVSINGRKLHIFTYKFTGRTIDKEPVPEISGEHKGYKWVKCLPPNIEYSGNTINFFNQYKFKKMR